MRICRIVGVLFLWISIFGFHSCQDDAANAGSSILEQDDEIRVKADTFGVISALDSCAAFWYSFLEKNSCAPGLDLL